MELIRKLAVCFILTKIVSGWFICPRSCECRGQSVDCSHRGFKEFPTYFPPLVDHLNLTGNELHYLPDTLYNLQTLANLNLAWNQLHYIQETSFQRLWNLETLDLSGNKFNRLSEIHGVSYLYKLKELVLQNNPIKETGSCALDDSLYSESINKLDLSKCILTNIDPCAFLRLSNLTHLYLSGNPLHQLTQIISESLEYLDMSNCNIHFITTHAFEKLPSLKYLDISKNSDLRVYTPFNNAYMSESIIHLDISNCGMTELITSDFPNLKYVSFKGNFIRELPSKSLFQNKQLIKIDLSENLISQIHYGAFIEADSLEQIDLSSNFIMDFHPGIFSHLYDLRNLNLSQNPLKSLNNISALSLQHLDASGCDIKELSSTIFFNIPSIQTLNLSNNPIEYLPNELHLSNLEELDLSYCRIILIYHKTFEKLIKLKKLDLRGNRLTNTFQESTMISLNNVTELLITNNPWQCRCNSTDHATFLSFVEKRSPVIDQQGLTCVMPDSQLQVLWVKACIVTETKDVKNFRSERHWTAFLVTFAVMSSIVLVLLVLRHNFSLNSDTTAQNDQTDSNVTPYPVRSPIADILQLPTYEEAILLPKPGRIDDPLNSRTREVSTWTSVTNLNNTDDGDNGFENQNDNADAESYPLNHDYTSNIENENDDNDNDSTENCRICHCYDSVNVSSTSL